ncbi:MAG TPA: hypothetical protein VJO52_01060 [Gemmatimonadaceae bacterium]|nr:hypothetical protein [Gemmatimonadaceae bacterium]
MAGAILALWAGGLATLARRQFAGGEAARLERAALFVSPGADYYAVSDGDKQIGYASSTIDTTQTRVRISDFVAADVAGGARFAARLQVSLTRALRLTGFCYELGADAGPYHACGTVVNDTLLALSITGKDARKITRRIRLTAPLFLPTMVPMIIALGERPKVGQRFTYEVFDPATDSSALTTIAVTAESLFVLPDSASYDAAGQRWVPAHQDSVRAWRIEEQNGGRLTGWIDESGRMVQADPIPGMQMRRTAYELAYSNWERGTPRDAHAARAAAAPPPTPSSTP